MNDSEQDLILKNLAMESGALQELGIPDIELEAPLPTEIAVVKASRRLDTVFRARDGSVFHLEFQSTKNPEDIKRFFEYDFFLSQMYDCSIRTVVLYTNGITSADDTIDSGVLRYHVENVYMANMDGDSALAELAEIAKNGAWHRRFNGKLAFLFHMHFRHLRRGEILIRMRDIVEKIEQREDRSHLALLINTLSMNNIVDLAPEEKRTLKEMGVMNSFMNEWLEEKLQEGREEAMRSVAKEMLAKHYALQEISRITHLSEDDILRLKSELAH